MKLVNVTVPCPQCLVPESRFSSVQLINTGNVEQSLLTDKFRLGCKALFSILPSPAATGAHMAISALVVSEIETKPEQARPVKL